MQLFFRNTLYISHRGATENTFNPINYFKLPKYEEAPTAPRASSSQGGPPLIPTHSPNYK